MGRYRQALAVAVVVLFFSGVDLYLFVADYTTVTPRDWVLLFGLLVAPLALHVLHRHQRLGAKLGRLVLWSLAYMAISLVWYSFSPSEAAVQELRDRMLAAGFMCLTAFIFTTPESRHTAARTAIVVALVMIVINGIEMVQPDWFFMQVPTRASGLYGNANACGSALVLGLIVGRPLVPHRLRLAFYLLIGIGVAITFSRSAMLGWLLTSVLLLGFDLTRTRAREFGIGALAAVVVSLVLFEGAAASGVLAGFKLDDNLFGRVSFFKTLEVSDDAAQQRREVAVKAWEMFAARPLAGNGLASTVQWSELTSAHNMFLYFMADHGILGAFILPALLVCVFLGRPGAAPGSHWAFCVFVVWLAFFSHNIFTERYQLLAFAFFAMGGTVEAQAARSRLVRASRAVGGAMADAFPSPVGAR